MGPNRMKKNVYKVMTCTRELANYCQESVRSCQSKKISESLNNFHLNSSIDFVTKSLTDDDRSCFELSDIDSGNQIESVDMPIYNKVIDYIETYLIESDL